MRKKLLVIGATVVLAMTSLTGCGKSNTTENSSEADATAESVTSEEVASDTEAEEIVEEDNTWFGENNITFTEGEVSAPVYTYARNEDGTVDESVEMTQMDGSYSEPVIEVSEPDENNNVTYTVTYDVIVPWVGMLSAEQAQSGCQTGLQIKNFMFMDAYTGTVFPSSDLTEGNEHEYAIESEVEVDGKTYHVSASSKMEQEQGEPDWTWLNNNTNAKLKLNYTLHCTQTVVAPADYDGLILFLDGNGKTEYEEMDTEVSEAHPFKDDIATTYFKDVTYGKIAALKAGDMYLEYRGSENDEIDLVWLNNNQLTWYSYTKWEQEEVCNDGFVKIKWKDGTCTNIEYDDFGRWDNPDGDYGYGLYFNPIDISQVQSIVIGDEEFSKGQAKSVE